MDGRRLVVTGYLLTGIAGWVDAQGFLALKGVFVSFMSGNTTLLGLALAPGNWTQAGPIAVVIGLFLAGGFVGAFMSEVAGRWSMPAVLLAEAIILALALALSAGGGWVWAGAALLALAMGVQNAAAASAGPVKAGATYVTGTLVSAGQALGRLARGTGSASVFVDQISLWLALLVGVTAGALAHGYVGLPALAVPCAAAAMLALYSALAVGRG